MIVGIYASISGTVGIVSALLSGSLAILIAALAIAGVGFGAAFPASLRLIMPLAVPQQRAGIRAGIVAVIYVVAYVAFGLPVGSARQSSSHSLALSRSFASAAALKFERLCARRIILSPRKGVPILSEPHGPDKVSDQSLRQSPMPAPGQPRPWSGCDTYPCASANNGRTPRPRTSRRLRRAGKPSELLSSTKGMVSASTAG